MATVVHVAGIEVLRVEVQEHAASPAKGGRPTVPVVADVRQSAQSPIIARVAEARGGTPRRGRKSDRSRWIASPAPDPPAERTRNKNRNN